MKKPFFVSLRETALNVIVALFFLKATLAFVEDYLDTHRLTSLMFVIFLAHFAFFALIRRHPKSVTKIRLNGSLPQVAHS